MIRKVIVMGCVATLVGLAGLVLWVLEQPEVRNVPIKPPITLEEAQRIKNQAHRRFVMFWSCENLQRATLSRSTIARVKELGGGDVSYLEAYFDELDAIYIKWCKNEKAPE